MTNIYQQQTTLPNRTKCSAGINGVHGSSSKSRFLFHIQHRRRRRSEEDLPFVNPNWYTVSEFSDMNDIRGILSILTYLTNYNIFYTGCSTGKVSRFILAHGGKRNQIRKEIFPCMILYEMIVLCNHNVTLHSSVRRHYLHVRQMDFSGQYISDYKVCFDNTCSISHFR